MFKNIERKLSGFEKCTLKQQLKINATPNCAENANIKTLMLHVTQNVYENDNVP